MILIDANKLIERVLDRNDVKIGTRLWLCGIIRSQPAMCNVDKVVELMEVEEEMSYADFGRYVDEICPQLDGEYDDLFHRGMERAIKIIKENIREKER